MIVFYRYMRFLYIHKLEFVAKFLKLLSFIIFNCNISYKCKIGKGTFFLHKGMSSLILDNVVIGDNCRIGMNIMIIGRGPYKEVPIIGNNVWIGPGSIISGPVIIEDNVIIAPNAVINFSVPNGAIVGGVPARIIGWSKDLEYEIMKNENWKEGFLPFLTDHRQ